MKPSKHIFNFLLMTAGLLISSQPAVMAQGQLGTPVKTCQTDMDTDCDLKINDSRDQVPIPGTLSQDISPEKRSDVLSHLNSLHVPFITNQGQVNKNVKFYAKTFGGTLFVTDKGEIVYSLSEVEGSVGENSNLSSNKMEESQNGGRKHFRSLAIREELIGAKVNGVNGEGEAITKVGYFKGNDPSKWKSGISTHGSVSLGEVYKGIELTLKAYGNNVEKLFYVNPSADPGIIRLKFSGSKGIKVNEDGELEVATELGIVRFTKPVAYQENSDSSIVEEGRGEGEKNFIEVAYVVEGDSYSFKLGDYDKSSPIVIDPLLASTFIGGSYYDQTGGDYDESAYTIAIDATGNVYVTGRTMSSDFPTAGTPYDTSYNGGASDQGDVFVSKFNSNLSNLLASTFIGGSDPDTASAIALDSTGNVYVAGNAESGYPIAPIAGTPYDSSHNGGITDVFVSKLDANLSAGTSLPNDADGDGLLDGWEIQNGLAATDSTGINGPSGDPDGDSPL